MKIYITYNNVYVHVISCDVCAYARFIANLILASSSLNSMNAMPFKFPSSQDKVQLKLVEMLKCGFV